MTLFAFIFGILIGLAAGAAFHFLRAFEVKRALAVSNYLRAVSDRTASILAGEVVRRDVTLANIKALAMRAHRERILVLGGSISLPDPARRTRQLTGSFSAHAGPSNGGPRFLGRGDAQWEVKDRARKLYEKRGAKMTEIFAGLPVEVREQINGGSN